MDGSSMPQETSVSPTAGLARHLIAMGGAPPPPEALAVAKQGLLGGPAPMTGEPARRPS